MEKTILLVDDEDDTREILARAIGRKGVKVLSAECGQKGIDLYKEHKPACVFLDVKLPDIEGPEVLKKMKEVDPQAKVYFMTGVSNEDYALQQEAKELGAAGYLGKPILIEDIFKIIDGL